MLNKKRFFYSFLIVLIITISNTLAQFPPQVKKVESVRPGLYKVEYYQSPYTSVKGYISHSRDNFIREGIWVTYRHGHPVQRMKYVNGVQMWIELENGKKLTREQIEIYKLKKRINELEKLVYTNKN